jgi:hypothetical protein
MNANGLTFTAIVEDVLAQLEGCLGDGSAEVRIDDRSKHLAFGYRTGLYARTLAAAYCADNPRASAAIYDSIRAMVEGAAALDWMAFEPSDVERRSLCLTARQAEQRLDNAQKVSSLYRRDIAAPGTRSTYDSFLLDAYRQCSDIRQAHAECSPHFPGVQKWLHRRASQSNASLRTIQVYEAWKWSSADAHQMVPERFFRPDGTHRLDLPANDIAGLIGLVLMILFFAYPSVAYVLQGDAKGERFDALFRASVASYGPTLNPEGL